jgi:hypothetical protein
MPQEPILVRPMGKRARMYQIGAKAHLFYRVFSLMVTAGLIIVGFSVPVCTFVLKSFTVSLYGIVGGFAVTLIGMAGTVAVAWTGRPPADEPDTVPSNPWKDAAFTQDNDYRPLYTASSLVTAVILLVLSLDVFIWNLLKSRPLDPRLLIMFVPSAAIILIRGREWLNRRK